MALLMVNVSFIDASWGSNKLAFVQRTFGLSGSEIPLRLVYAFVQVCVAFLVTFSD